MVTVCISGDPLYYFAVSQKAQNLTMKPGNTELI